MQHYEIKVVSLQLTKDDGMRPMGPKREVAKSKTTCFTVNDNMMINKYN